VNGFNIIFQRFINSHQEAEDYICGCVVNSSWRWE